MRSDTLMFVRLYRMTTPSRTATTIRTHMILFRDLTMTLIWLIMVVFWTMPAMPPSFMNDAATSFAFSEELSHSRIR